MAFDEVLAERLRAQLSDRDDVTEKRMFGSQAFLVGGHLACAASGQGGLLVRVAPENADEALDQPHAEPFVMRGRPVEGWILVRPGGVATDAELGAWVERSLAFVGALPPKAARAR
ncbi:MAG TPA: TfoX/Sxy family protein [Capillimicrobium sp.]|nr:TfoX/Sxy family protein [Capillimicrobium sp.]